MMTSRLVRPFLHWRRADLADLVVCRGPLGKRRPQQPRRAPRTGQGPPRCWRTATGSTPPPSPPAPRTSPPPTMRSSMASRSNGRGSRDEAGTLSYDPQAAPSEIRRRIAARMIAALGKRGRRHPPARPRTRPLARRDRGRGDDHPARRPRPAADRCGTSAAPRARDSERRSRHCCAAPAILS